MTDICITVDLEQDCPPYLTGWRGMEEGSPLLLALLERCRIPATFFTTGATGENYPRLIEALVENGHELASHGQTHKAFSSMESEEAEWEIETSTAILRAYGPVTAFRAPYLRFPEKYLPLLENRGYETDASRSRYKPIHWGPPASTPLRRILASTTSSVLRLPPWIRDPLLAKLQSPVVLFVHPWEFVDLRKEPIPWDSRLGTGDHALRSLEEVIRIFQRGGARFRTVSDLSG
jgi:peptidoglycan/xylan/chitin deacetylase (PgdA/CDA1 family)